MALPEDQTASTPHTFSEENELVQISEREDVTPAVEAEFMRAAQVKGSVDKLPELQENLEQVHVLVRQVYAAAGMEAKISMTESEPDKIHVELDTGSEFSPEQLAIIIRILKTRYEKNEHGIPCHTDVPWRRIEAKLKANPAKLDTLKKMEDSGGAPDVYKVEGEDFIFGDLFTKPAECRRNVNYIQAVVQASIMGADLISPDDYEEIGNDLGISLDGDPSHSWLKTPDDELLSGCAYVGQNNSVVELGMCDVGYSRDCTFRCSLRV